MRIKMKSKLLCTMMAVMSALVVTEPIKRTAWPTTGTPGLNLNGKMFTLSSQRGGVSFYPPYFSTSSSLWPPDSTTKYTTTRRPHYTTTRRPHYTTTRHPHYTTTTTTRRPYYTTTRRPYYTTTRPYYTTTRRPYYTTTRRPYYTTNSYPYTTAPPTRGLSVCLRYLIDNGATLFTLSPSSSNPLRMGIDDTGSNYILTTRSSYYSLFLRPRISFWSFIGPDIWNRVCLTVDSMKNVAQVFSGSHISVRKLLPFQYVWQGEPVINFSGFDGQVTDVQIWDYPLRYKEVFNYMTNSNYGLSRGSVLSWSYISYSPGGNTLLEDSYEWQGKQPISRGRRGHQHRGRKKTQEFSNWRKSKRGQLK